jgi:hypothetical protein
VRVTRRHHPLEGRLVEVVTGGPTQIVVRLEDGTVMRLPRAWTDADGASPRADSSFRKAAMAFFAFDRTRADRAGRGFSGAGSCPSSNCRRRTKERV